MNMIPWPADQISDPENTIPGSARGVDLARPQPLSTFRGGAGEIVTKGSTHG